MLCYEETKHLLHTSGSTLGAGPQLCGQVCGWVRAGGLGVASVCVCVCEKWLIHIQQHMDRHLHTPLSYIHTCTCACTTPPTPDPTRIHYVSFTISLFLHPIHPHFYTLYTSRCYKKPAPNTVYFDDVRLQMDSKALGELYNKTDPPRKVDFVQVG